MKNNTFFPRHTEYNNKLAHCPCCGGKAYFADIHKASLIMWQVICEQCGLTTLYDEDKKLCEFYWNRRVGQQKTKQYLLTTLIALPFLTVLCFLMGVVLGMHLNPL